jgi:hypothetical protein
MDLAARLCIAAVLLGGMGCSGDDTDDDDSAAGDDDTSDDDDAGDDDSAEADDDDSAAAIFAPISDVVVTLHPDITTVPVVSWTQHTATPAGWIQYSFDGRDWMRSPARPCTPGGHSQALFGVPAEAEVTLRLVNEIDGRRLFSETSHTVTTGELPRELPEPALKVWERDATSPGDWFLASLEYQNEDWYRGPWFLFVLDREGRIVWYYPVPHSRCTMHARVALDGTHVLLEETTIYQGDNGEDSRLRRLTLGMGYDEEIPAPFLGSTFAETTDGTVLYDDYSGFPVTWLSELMPDGTSRQIWNCMEWAHGYGLNVWGCDPNETIWVPGTDTVLWSMWGSDTVVEIDRETGTLLHQFGRIADGWSFDPAKSRFEMQHYPYYTDAGTLLTSTHTLSDPPEQRAREFIVDEHDQTLVEIWTYGEGVGRYATYAGEAIRLPGGNTLINYGTGADLREVTHDKEVVWEVEWDETYLIGHVSLIEDLYALDRGPGRPGAAHVFEGP